MLHNYSTLNEFILHFVTAHKNRGKLEHKEYCSNKSFIAILKNLFITFTQMHYHTVYVCCSPLYLLEMNAEVGIFVKEFW